MAADGESRPQSVWPPRKTPEAVQYRGRARRLGLPFVSHVRLDSRASLGPDDDIQGGKVARNRARDLIIAPDDDAMADVAAWLRAHPRQRAGISVATPTAVRAALREATAGTTVAAARDRVEAVDRSFSARHTFETRQVAVGAFAAALLVAGLLLRPTVVVALCWLVLAFFFFSVSFVRWLAAGEARQQRGPVLPSFARAPVYTVLVPLRHEAHMIPQIVAGLDRLIWPRDRLDIKLVIDADDIDTLSVARALAAEPPYEVVEVPAGGPRTKPMALQYALAFARGSFVTVYDAEDRPHPGQLAEAYVTFSAATGPLACLQAPLLVDNDGAGWLPALFAIEYAALFDGLLPSLAHHRLPLPLGGTSNHFRRGALEHVGGWDPYNVTEDADLGIRLARFGYHTGTITLPTREEAPVGLRPWLNQRTRWMKGWMQTWLVHMRHPLALWRSTGAWQFLGFQLLGLGMIVSAIAHPLFILTPLWIALDPLSLWRGGGVLAGVFAGLTLFNLAFGYLAMWRLSTRALDLRGRRQLARYIVLLPVYWLLVGLATVRAAWELLTDPHRWNKTAHTETAGTLFNTSKASDRSEAVAEAANAAERLAIGAAEHGHQLRHFPALVLGVATGDRRLHAMGDVVAQNGLLDPPERGADGRYLGDDVDAVAVFGDHAR